MAAADEEEEPYQEPEELVELQLIEEARLEKLFAEQRQQRGLDDTKTLETFFHLFDMWIQLYRLNKCAEALEEVVPVCRKRGNQLHIRGVQALAFTRWKQGQFKVAAELFHEIEGLIGSSSALCENIGHTYSSMGDYPEASKYFQRALQCMDEEEKAGRKVPNKAGVLLGLGLIEDRMGNLEKALEIIRESQTLFRQKAAGKPSSLIAKAGMSIAKLLLKLAETEPDMTKRLALEEEAIVRERENVEIFEITCGADSPLTASALRGLGEALMRRHHYREAQESFATAYNLEAQKDHFELVTVMELHNLLFNAHMAEMRTGGELDRKAFRNYLPTVDLTLGRVRSMRQDGNAGAYYKVAAELRAFAEDYAGAAVLLGDAIRLFEVELPDHISGLTQTCIELQEFCKKQLKAQIAAAREANRTNGAEAPTSGPKDTE